MSYQLGRNFIHTQSTPLKNRFRAAILSCALIFSGHLPAGEILPLAVDLQKSGQAANQRNVPVVVFATATWCGYCKNLEENILEPLLQTTNIESYAEFSQLVMDKSHWRMKDFSGKDIEMRQLPDQLGVMVAPTTLFFDGNGKQIAPPILGLTLEEHYPSNLERGINQALEALGNPMRVDIYKMVNESKVDYQPR